MASPLLLASIDALGSDENSVAKAQYRSVASGHTRGQPVVRMSHGGGQREEYSGRSAGSHSSPNQAGGNAVVGRTKHQHLVHVAFCDGNRAGLGLYDHRIRSGAHEFAGIDYKTGAHQNGLTHRERLHLLPIGPADGGRQRHTDADSDPVLRHGTNSSRFRYGKEAGLEACLTGADVVNLRGSL
jgi:hypothetical protein